MPVENSATQPLPETYQLAESVAAEIARYLDDVVICPGSRNAPLSLALLARTDIRVHTRHDERSAAFLALGLARVQRRHVAVCMTSGSAVANALPAMVEAAHSHTPLVVLSADRPERLVGTGASQTIQQQGIFGQCAQTVQVAGKSDLPAVAEALSTAWQVHINVALDTPLVGSEMPPVHEGQPGTRAQGPGFVDHGEVEVDLRRNTLVIAGDEAWEVAGLEDVPTIAEPSAPAPYHPVHPAAAYIFRKAQVSANNYVVDTKVEQVIVVGHPTLHRGVLALMNDPDIELISLSRTPDFTNPRGDKARLGSRVKTTGEPTRDWYQICQGAAEMGADAVRETLSEFESDFTGLHVAAAVADTLAVDDALVIGASNPIRDMSLVGLPFGGVDTYSPRGAAGIDGTVAQAIGVALATQTREAAAPRAPRTIALMGDVTFLHDLTGLLIAPEQPRPENLTIVVANDDGCGIFETLEIGHENLRPAFEQAFGTPHAADLEAAVAAFGADYRSAETSQELLDILAELKEDSAGITVVEAKTSRKSRRQLQESIAAKAGR